MWDRINPCVYKIRYLNPTHKHIQAGRIFKQAKKITKSNSEWRKENQVKKPNEHLFSSCIFNIHMVFRFFFLFVFFFLVWLCVYTKYSSWNIFSPLPHFFSLFKTNWVVCLFCIRFFSFFWIFSKTKQKTYVVWLVCFKWFDFEIVVQVFCFHCYSGICLQIFKNN